MSDRRPQVGETCWRERRTREDVRIETEIAAPVAPSSPSADQADDLYDVTVLKDGTKKQLFRRDLELVA